MSKKALKRISLFICLLMLAAMPVMAFEGNPDTSSVYSWVANDGNGQEDENGYGNQVLHEIGGMFVTPDGTVYTNCDWEEDGHNFEEIKDGKVIKNGGYSHGWGYQGGFAVTANDKYVYFSQRAENEGGKLYDQFPTQYPPTGSDWQGVQRRLREDIQTGVGFEGGTGRAGSPASLTNSFLPILTGPVKATYITGMACTNERLYVASYTANKIFVYDAETMAQLDEWDVEGANTIVLDKNGILWVNQLSTRTILSFEPDGTKRDAKITFDEGVIPWALCVDNQNRLMISDHGPKEWIMVYDHLDSTPALSHTIGAEGGIYSGTPGIVDEMKFKHITGLGVDAEDNLYVANNGVYFIHGVGDPRCEGQTYIECYDKNGQKLWDAKGLAFVDGMVTDSRDETSIYSGTSVFKMDYTKSPGEEWSYYSYTLDPHRFPDDPRIYAYLFSWMNPIEVTYIQDQKLMFAIDQNGESLGVYRYDPENYGETAIPCAFFHRIMGNGVWPEYEPQSGNYAWMDKNGDGQMDENEFFSTSQTWGVGRDWSVAANGDLYRASDNCALYHIPFKGFNRYGVPEWDVSDMSAITLGEEYKGFMIRRTDYESETDTMYLSLLDPKVESGWRDAGNLLVAYSNWSNEAKRQKLFAVELPSGDRHYYTNLPDMAEAIDVAGDYVFVGYASRPLTYIFDKKTGDLYDMIIPPFEIGTSWALVDIATTYQVTKLQNGEYAILIEDDLKSKNWVLRWTDKGGPKNYNEGKALGVSLDNRQLIFNDQEPMILDDRTMVPMRYIFQTLDAEVTWDGENRVVTGKKDGKSVILQIDSTTATINGSRMELDVPAQIVNDRTMIPLRVVAEGLGVEVEWIPEENLVNIITDKSLIKGYGEPVKR